MSTHSQLVDDLVAELMRPDLRAAFSNYLNQTIRDLHYTVGEQGAQPIPVGFVGNLGEDFLTANAETGFSYTLENPHRFQMLECVYYAMFRKYATERKPSSIRAFDGMVDGSEFGYYRSGNQVFFDNYGGTNAQIAIAWFDHIQRQSYYAAGQRPCTWNQDTESYTYHTVGSTDYNSTPELQERARFLCTNWMLERWYDTLLQGVRAKIWARLADDVRSKTAYSLFQAMRTPLINTETMIITPRYRS